MDVVLLVLVALAGVIIAAFSCFIPGLHIYNLIAIIVLLHLSGAVYIDPEIMCFLFIGMIVGYSFFNVITSVFMSAPDESLMFFIFPAQRYFLEGRGFEASMLIGVGSLVAVMFLAASVPFLPILLPRIWELTRPLLGWLILLVIVFILLTEWPRGLERSESRWERFKEAWSSPLAGFLTFALAGFFGIVLFFKPPIPPERGFVAITPAFIGIFALPWAITNVLSKFPKVEQHITDSINVKVHEIIRGGGAGFLAGMFGAFFPAITAGVAGFLAGHATAQKGDRLFIISQGASRAIYYMGAFLLFFLPTMHITRGALAWMTGLVFTPERVEYYYLAAFTMLLCAGVSFLLLTPITKLAIKLVHRYGIRTLSIFSIISCIAIVLVLTSWEGLLIMAVGAVIGMIPLLFNCRRSNTLAVILVPLGLNIIGLGPTIAELLGLFG